MNVSVGVNTDVLIASGRIHAALKIIPRIIGPKEVWGPWMRDNLQLELVSKVFTVIRGGEGIYPRTLFLGRS